MASLSILRANNPCALRPLGRARWNGQTGVIRLKGGAYAEFGDMVHGLRAGLRNLDTYRRVHGLHSPDAIIRRWAPRSDNNPEAAYAAHIAARLGVARGDPIPFDHASTRALLLAIIAFETGGWAPAEADVDAAFRMMATEEERAGRDPSPYRSGRVSDDLRRQPARRPGLTYTGLGAVLTTVLAGLAEAGAALWARIEHWATPGALDRLTADPALLHTALVAAAAVILTLTLRKVLRHAPRQDDLDPARDAAHGHPPLPEPVGRRVEGRGAAPRWPDDRPVHHHRAPEWY